MSSFLKASLPSDDDADEDFIPTSQDVETDQEIREELKVETNERNSVDNESAKKAKIKAEQLWKQLQKTHTTKRKTKTASNQPSTLTSPKSQNNDPAPEHKASAEEVITLQDTGEKKQGVVKGSRKRSISGVSAILESIEKKKKVNVLEKSKTDWKEFKKSHKSDAEDLKAHQKSSGQYLEKTEFLNRVQAKQNALDLKKKSRAKQ